MLPRAFQDARSTAICSPILCMGRS
ncbi:hypothetical protein PMIN01_01604 [Paraphaeosphaeria minitans]|uniref:Uncharacterized protein n=1 Tax=Paraphaeosphaeria minitans TaxID=565426 RepID=A0A9P6KU56_9PLEO|nr:hypothetical protein PMIN01_01604 [Paraphaeosphaeria minitans]